MKHCKVLQALENKVGNTCARQFTDNSSSDTREQKGCFDPADGKHQQRQTEPNEIESDIVNENGDAAPCECYDEWEHFNETHYMRDMISSQTTSWRHVQSGTECDEYEDSLFANEAQG